MQAQHNFASRPTQKLLQKHTHIEAFARYQALNGLARAAISDFFYTILLPG